MFFHELGFSLGAINFYVFAMEYENHELRRGSDSHILTVPV